MKKKKLIIALAAVVLLIAVLSLVLFFVSSENRRYVKETKDFKTESISLESDYRDFLWDLGLDNGDSFQEIEGYESDSAGAYINSKGQTTVYMFASPIRYYNASGDLTLIDTRISNVQDSSHGKYYAYRTNKNDLIAYYPKRLDKGILLEGSKYKYSFGFAKESKAYADYQDSYKTIVDRDRQTVSYASPYSGTELFFYPSRFGTGAEIQLNEYNTDNKSVELWVDTNGAECVLSESGYIVLQKGDAVEDIVGVIQSPILIDSAGNISVNSTFSVEQNFGSDDKISLVFDREFLESESTVYPVKCYLSFELKRSNQPDSAVFSGKPNINSFLSSYNFIGQNPELGKGELRVRFKLRTIENLSVSSIDKVYYKVHSLTSNSDEFEIRYLLETWCSQMGSWSEPIKEGEQISTAKLSGGLIEFDITNAVRQWSSGSNTLSEDDGFILRSQYQKDGVWNVLTSNDNSLYNNVTEILLEKGSSYIGSYYN